MSDGYLEDSGSFTITVTPINDAPAITGGDDLSTPEATPLTITLGNLSVEDIDNNYPDDFTLTVLDGDNYSLQGGSGSAPYSYPNDFSYVTTPASGAFLGQVTINGEPAQDNGVDIIGAFEATNGFCVGTASFVSGGNIYALNIYGDDSSTPEDDGMNPGDNFILCVYDASEGEVYCSDTEFDQWTNENGTIMPAYSDWQAVYAFESSGGGDGNTIVPDDDFAGNLSVPVYVDDGEAENSQSNTFELTVSVLSLIHI